MPFVHLAPKAEPNLGFKMDTERIHQLKSRRLFLIAWSAAVIFIICVSAGFVLARQQRIQRQTGEREQVAARGLRVLVTQLALGASTRTIELPASVHGYTETPVYAKLPGYMKTINVDKGDRVKTGQVIAVIQSPETDKQVGGTTS